MHWKRLSPDLGIRKGETPPPTGGGTIVGFSTSSVAPGVIWVGTSNGLIKLTKDHGVTWDDVTMAECSAGGDASLHHRRLASGSGDRICIDGWACRRRYDAVHLSHARLRQDLDENLQRSRHEPAARKFCPRRSHRHEADRVALRGTESSVYVSLDDGDSWQSLMLNLPTTAFRDMVIKDNDLVVGTYGRSIWILDDFSPLRQITAAVAAEPAHLFKPADAYRVRRNINAGTPFPPEIPHGDNPPLGAILYYHLGSKPTGYITLDISDKAGRVVRHMSSAPIAPYPDPPPRLPDWWLTHPKPMPTEIGTNRINWYLRVRRTAGVCSLVGTRHRRRSRRYAGVA